MCNHKFMEEAVSLAAKGMAKNDGGPFGAIIVKDGIIVGRGNNKVTSNNDPTAHAEVVAIRDACKTLNAFQLEGCEIYTSCEPCPMCLGAIYWARLGKIYYANTRADASHIGFDDAFIYNEFNKDIDKRSIPLIQLGREEALKVFNEWAKKQDKIFY